MTMDEALFAERIQELAAKARVLFKERKGFLDLTESFLTSFAASEFVYQHADRLATLVMYEKSKDEIERQVIELLMALVITDEFVKRGR